MLAEEPHGHAAFTSGGRDHLGRARANISDCEHAGPAGLDQERIAAQGSPRVTLTESAAQCWPGEDEAVIVEGELRDEPLRRRLRADEHDYRTGVDGPSFAGNRFLNGHAFEATVPADAPHLATQQHLDSGIGGNSL